MALDVERPRVRVNTRGEILGGASLSTFAHLAGLPPQEQLAPAAGSAPAPASPQAAAKAKGKGKVKKKTTTKGEDDPDDEEENPDGDEDGDDDSDEKDMRGGRGETIQCARSRERARCAAIFAAPQAANNLPLAAHLAFGTDQTRSQAIETLAAAPVNAGGLAQRMAGVPNPPVGAGAAAESAVTDHRQIDASWDRVLCRHNRR